MRRIGLAALRLKTNKPGRCLCCLPKRRHLYLRFIVARPPASASGSPDRSCLQSHSLGSSWCRPPTEHSRTCDGHGRLSRGPPCSMRSYYKGTLSSACACRPTACSWRELLVAAMCSRISFPWRDSGARWRLRGRVRIPARNFPKLRCRQHDNEIIPRCFDRRT